MGDCGHDTGCDCMQGETQRSVWHRYEPTAVRLQDRPRLGVHGHLEVCPHCKGASLHKASCPRRAS